MQQKIIFGMVGGFIAFTVMAIVVVYAFSVNLPLEPKKNADTVKTTAIALDPKPNQVLGSGTDKPMVPTATPAPNPASASMQSNLKIDVSSLYSLINAHRKEKQLSSLRVNQALELSSRKKLEDMRVHNYWRHENTQGVMDWSIFDQSGYHYSVAGENLSFANNSAWSVFDSWVNSPIHNEQLLKAEYEDMGVAIDCENYRESGEKKCAVVLHLGRQQ